jgi:hypothetical protein
MKRTAICCERSCSDERVPAKLRSVLVPKLQLGNALVFEASLRRSPEDLDGKTLVHLAHIKKYHFSSRKRWGRADTIRAGQRGRCVPNFGPFPCQIFTPATLQNPLEFPEKVA